MSKRPRSPEVQARLDRIIAMGEEMKAEGLRRFVEPRFTLSAITAGLRIPEVTIRNWLTRNQVDLGAAEGHQRGKWRLFSVSDVLVLATCYQLSRHGVPVSVFSMVYERIVALGAMYFSGPIGMVRRPVGILYYSDGHIIEEGEEPGTVVRRREDHWVLIETFDSGPFHATDDAPVVSILIDYDRIISSTLNRLGMNFRLVTTSDLEPEA